MESLGYHFVCMDFPGHGKSSHRPSKMYAMAEYASDVLETVRELQWDAEPFTLVGHSLGGAKRFGFAAKSFFDWLLSHPPRTSPSSVVQELLGHWFAVDSLI